MESTRDIQRKIRTVRNIQQICRAMKTVSSIKLRKSEERVRATEPYTNALRGIIQRLSAGEASHPYLEARDVRHTVVVVISGDKGLAGSYNANLIRQAAREVGRLSNVEAITIGRKVTDAFTRTDMAVNYSVSPMGTPEFRTYAALADYIGERYAHGVWDRVELVYTTVGGAVVTEQLLPVRAPEGVQIYGDVIYEPNPTAILDQLLPRYLRTILYTAVLSAVAAEHAARVAAMSLASENAEEMIDRLTMDYNKSRQAAITRELTDIVGAASALR
jgi:F-type H+-transporting ATPase subunit gamma